MILRAWREVTDDVQAGAAKWDQRWGEVQRYHTNTRETYTCPCNLHTTNRAAFWRHLQTCVQAASPSSANATRPTQIRLMHHTLAQRLDLTRPTIWHTEQGWRARVLFTWQRLVRAGRVRKTRRGSDMWQQAERNRMAHITNQYRDQMQQEGDWVMDNTHIRGQRYDWHAQADAQRHHQGATSGAAAIIARRPAIPDPPQSTKKRARDANINTTDATDRTQRNTSDAISDQVTIRNRQHDAHLSHAPNRRST